MTTPQPQPSAETRARELVVKICSDFSFPVTDLMSETYIKTIATLITKADERDAFDYRTIGNLLEENDSFSGDGITVVKDKHYLDLLNERNSFRAKAEALDMLATGNIDLRIWKLTNNETNFNVHFKDGSFVESRSLLSAITTAKNQND